jgi:hypothetical protein
MRNCRVIGAVALTLVFAALGCSSSTTRTAAAEDISWLSARTDGDQALVIVYAGAPLQTGPTCTRTYGGEVTETAASVTVTVAAGPERIPAGGCASDAKTATITVDLTQPIGDRQLIDGATGEQHNVFDGSTLAAPAWLPEGWTGGEIGTADAAAVTWTRNWGLPGTEGLAPCTLSGVSLTEGDPSVVFGGRPQPAAAATSPQTAERLIGPLSVELLWTTDGRAYDLRSISRCAEADPPSTETIETVDHIAQSL